MTARLILAIALLPVLVCVAPAGADDEVRDAGPEVPGLHVPPPEPEPPVPRRRWGRGVETLAAASCFGEAGFRRDTSGPECVAILEVYQWRWHHRWNRHGMTLASGIRAYSAAVKPRPRHPRPWLLELAAGRVPLELHRHRAAWDRTLEIVRTWLRGEPQPNPCPGAEHYGSTRDGQPEGTVEVCPDAGLRNRFWRRPPPS